MKKYLPLLLFVAAIAVVIFFLLRSPEGPGIRHMQPDLTVEAPTLFAAFANDEAEANETYLNKVVVVSGTVSEVTTSSNGQTTIHLESNNQLGKVLCTLDSSLKHNRQEFHRGEKLRLKGVCSDYYRDVTVTSCVEL